MVVRAGQLGKARDEKLMLLYNGAGEDCREYLGQKEEQISLF